VSQWQDKWTNFWRASLGRRYTGKQKRRMNTVLSVLVIINVVAIVLETANNMYPWVYQAIYIVNYAITVLFAIEYFLRWAYSGISRWRYVFTFASIIDLISIFPALFAYLFGFNLTHLTVLRLLRLYKFFRITKTMKLFNAVLIRSYKKLGFAFLIVFVVTVIASTLMYYAENAAQPEKFSSIIETMWWVVSSLTTAGYVPMSPVTVMGKILSSLIVVIGVGLFAIPAGIISAGFIEEYKLQRRAYLRNLQKGLDKKQKACMSDEMRKL
jgi:voltage-gated potassium channel